MIPGSTLESVSISYLRDTVDVDGEGLFLVSSGQSAGSAAE